MVGAEKGNRGSNWQHRKISGNSLKMLKMCPNSMKDKFVNVNNLVEELRDLFKCQVCFLIKDEESIFFYWNCHHLFCSSCLDRDKSCVICSESNQMGLPVKLSENDNILQVFRLLSDYESIFLPNEIEKSQNHAPEVNSKSTASTKALKKKGNKKTLSILDVSSTDDKGSQKKKKVLNVLKKNFKGETPLHLACRKANMPLMQDLINAGANPNMQDNAGWTPLHDSIVFGRKDVIKFLLENGARVNTPGHENTTALHQAVTERNCDIIRLLLTYGANKNARNIYGETPMDLVKKYNFTEIEDIMMTTPAKYKSKPKILNMSLMQEDDSVLYGFNLSESESSLLERFANQFDYKTAERLSLQLGPNIIITSDAEPKITWKIIPGVLMGCRVVNVKWLEDSLAKNSVQSVEEYEMKEEAYVGFAKSRQNQMDQLPGLFSGCHFYFGGNFEVYKTKNSSFLKTEIKILVEKNGGVILSRNPDPESLALEKTIPYHAHVNSSLAATSYYIIYSQGSWDPAPKYNMAHMKTLPVEWLLASIHKFELIDPKVDQSYMDYI